MKTKFVHGCQLHSAIYHSSLLDTAYKDGLYPKFEEKPVNGQKKTLSMFLEDTACPFYSGIWSKL